MLKKPALLLIALVTFLLQLTSCAWMRLNNEPELDPYQQAVQSGQIVLGMPMTEVRHLWGDPRDVETAGQSDSGNQRWIYSEGLTSRWSLTPTRVVYFEEGRVIGWKTSSR